MSIDAISAVSTDQSHVDAAYQRLAIALAEQKRADNASTIRGQSAQSEVGAARAALADAEAALGTDESAYAPIPPAAFSTPAHIVELVV